MLFIVGVGGGSHAPPPPLVGIPASSIELGHIGVIGHLGGYGRGGGRVPRSGVDPLIRKVVGGVNIQITRCLSEVCVEEATRHR